MTNLTGTVALVTGGGRGIGAAVARRLATDGADVAITYVHDPVQAAKVVADIEELGRRGLAIAADAADPDQVRAAVDRTADTLGRLDVLVNNAGIFATGPVEEVTLDEYDRIFAIHARAPFVAVQAALRYLPDGGRVVNVGSMLAERVPWPGVALYAASKSALTGLTRGLARDLGPRGITVNLVHPGATDTEMNPATSPRAAERARSTALGRYGTADEVADAVAYFAHPAARYVTGAALAVDGGATA